MGLRDSRYSWGMIGVTRMFTAGRSAQDAVLTYPVPGGQESPLAVDFPSGESREGRTCFRGRRVDGMALFRPESVMTHFAATRPSA